MRLAALLILFIIFMVNIYLDHNFITAGITIASTLVVSWVVILTVTQQHTSEILDQKKRMMDVLANFGHTQIVTVITHGQMKPVAFVPFGKKSGTDISLQDARSIADTLVRALLAQNGYDLTTVLPNYKVESYDYYVDKKLVAQVYSIASLIS